MLQIGEGVSIVVVPAVNEIPWIFSPIWYHVTFRRAQNSRAKIKINKYTLKGICTTFIGIFNSSNSASGTLKKSFKLAQQAEAKIRVIESLCNFFFWKCHYNWK